MTENLNVQQKPKQHPMAAVMKSFAELRNNLNMLSCVCRSENDHSSATVLDGYRQQIYEIQKEFGLHRYPALPATSQAVAKQHSKKRGG
jgi:hypothetical protein